MFYNCVAIREAETLEAATLALYTEYEHISGCHESTRYGVRDGRLYSLRADHADPTAP